ncbi:hypothetical protein NDI85_19970 [Halomicroarcula sp. S1AR25-4]|uniref:hypothetical protein n=1 Tax=Haloarcula sp. S1AR25-4 TaxID=2950538 RepID=UPI0028762AB4|nr:hypothetical protein [Halomicroarcula sp. S1AR25-4]MDS0280066.1 hypothetical protein [Halomicroarcula sp. S1AR25-4]
MLRRGDDGQRLIAIPKQDYDRLGLSLDVDADELPRILVYAGDQTLAFEQAGGVTRTVTRPEDDLDE